jgi:hypothetical protein
MEVTGKSQSALPFWRLRIDESGQFTLAGPTVNVPVLTGQLKKDDVLMETAKALFDRLVERTKNVEKDVKAEQSLADRVAFLEKELATKNGKLKEALRQAQTQIECVFGSIWSAFRLGDSKPEERVESGPGA